MNINKVILVGRLGKDPEYKELQGGNHVCKFSLATSNSWKDKKTGEWKSQAEWHRVVIWGPRAAACGEYLKKGSIAMIEGRISYGSYESKTGQKMYTTDIVAEQVYFQKDKEEQTQESYDLGPEPNFDSVDEIPF